MVSRWCDDPVVPADVFKVNVQLSFAADLDLLVTLQSTLLPLPQVAAILLLDHDYQKGPVGLVLLFAAHQERRCTGAGTQGAGDPKAQDCVLLALQQQLDGCQHRERVPATPAHVDTLLHKKDLMWPRSVGKASLLEETDGNFGPAAVGLCKAEEKPDVGLLHQGESAPFLGQDEVHCAWRVT